MPPKPKSLPPGLTERVKRRHPEHRVRFIRSEYVPSDAWNGTVFLFGLHDPRITPKAVTSFRICTFQLNQFDPLSEWTFDFYEPPDLTAKAAVLKARRNSIRTLPTGGPT